jgi:ribosomal protein L24
MEKFAENDRIDLMNQQKKRMKQIEHKRKADAMIEERRQIYQQNLELSNQEREKELEIERYKQAVIEQERQRLLREHASRLVGFLPKVYI